MVITKLYIREIIIMFIGKLGMAYKINDKRCVDN